MVSKRGFPDWLKKSLRIASSQETHKVLSQHKLHTVCESAMCPNRNECYSKHTATFLILGDRCTRSCGFCSVKKGIPEEVDPQEPERIAMAAKALGLSYIVITSVTRDDLTDEGAQHFAQTIHAVRNHLPESPVEVLTPDFHARKELIEIVTRQMPDVFNHNLETVERLQESIRPQASYSCSLLMLERVKELNSSIVTKSGFMVGLGERDDEVFKTALGLRLAGVEILTVGQYLRPALKNADVEKFVTPQKFEMFSKAFQSMGFKKVFAGPYVRSSYHADEVFSGLSARELIPKKERLSV